MNSITRNSVVTLGYSLSDTDGNLIDEVKEPLLYLHGGYLGIFPAVEAALEGKSVGDSVTVKLQPEEAFGEYDPELVDVVPVEDLPQPLTVGMHLEGTAGEAGEDGEDAVAYATVTDIADGKAVLDANHPLAGMALVFSCTVQGVRQATEQEIAALEAHGRQQ
jgi:FKBP-type peptidyl-prolyl cis-trans isomerase SlyD